MAHGARSWIETGRNQQVLDRRWQASPVVVLASLEATWYRNNGRGASGCEQSSPRESSSGAWTPPRSFSPTSRARRASLAATRRVGTARSGPNAPRQGSPSPARHDLVGKNSSGELPDRPRAFGGRLERLPRVIAKCRRLAATRRAGTTAPGRLPPCRARLRDVHAAAASPKQRLPRGPAHEPSDTPASIESGRELGFRADDRLSSAAGVSRVVTETLASTQKRHWPALGAVTRRRRCSRCGSWRCWDRLASARPPSDAGSLGSMRRGE